MNYYHVMKKDGAWHLFANNAPSALVTDVQQSRVVKAARSLARQNGGKIIFHNAAPRSGESSNSASDVAEM